MMFWKMNILFPLSVAILAQAFSAQNFVPFSHPFFSFALFAMAVYPGTNHANVAYVAHVAKNTQNPWRVLAPGMEVKEGFATYQDAVYAVEDQLQFNEKYGVPMGLSEALSRLALVAHLFKGCEVGYKAEEKLAKELLVKALSTRRINKAPLEALMVELGIPTKGEAKSMLLQRLAAVQNVVQDDDGLPEVMACGAGAPRVKLEAESEGEGAVPVNVKEEPGAVSISGRFEAGEIVKVEKPALSKCIEEFGAPLRLWFKSGQFPIAVPRWNTFTASGPLDCSLRGYCWRSGDS